MRKRESVFSYVAHFVTGQHAERGSSAGEQTAFLIGKKKQHDQAAAFAMLLKQCLNVIPFYPLLPHACRRPGRYLPTFRHSCHLPSLTHRFHGIPAASALPDAATAGADSRKDIPSADDRVSRLTPKRFAASPTVSSLLLSDSARRQKDFHSAGGGNRSCFCRPRKRCVE